VFRSADGVRWTALPFAPLSFRDDTQTTALYDPALGKYVVYVRRDCGPGQPWCVLPPGVPPPRGPGVVRFIGRCVTSNLSDWQRDLPAGEPCPIVFGADARDPPRTDVYTNAWTPYPSADAVAAGFGAHRRGRCHHSAPSFVCCHTEGYLPIVSTIEKDAVGRDDNRRGPVVSRRAPLLPELLRALLGRCRRPRPA
jgi:hypothetical protein